MTATLLLVEDDDAQRALVAELLRGAGHEVVEASSQAEAEQALESTALSLVISDYKLAQGDGLGLLASVRKLRPELSFVLVTAYGSIEHAVAAIHAGADDYLAKPFSRQALLLAVDKALRTRALREENRRLSDDLQSREHLVDLIGKAPAMQRLYRQIQKLAPTEATLLLYGESGTGKELVARAVHRLSRRSDGPFVAVNCAAIPEGLIEAEFFGAERGAYTGSHAARAGLFEQANGGTLFLDELGELPMSLQPKLLRALQEGCITRVGGRGEIRLDIRVVAASNRELIREVHEGRFREDLYYRIAVVTLDLPPLRERREDIPLLVDHFAVRARRQHGLPDQPLPKALLRALMDRPWPGNVRELGNVVERLLLLAEDEPSLHDLPATDAAIDNQFKLPAEGLQWEALERSLLGQALQRCDGNRSQAAALLGLTYKAFLYRLEKFGIDV